MITEAFIYSTYLRDVVLVRVRRPKPRRYGQIAIGIRLRNPDAPFLASALSIPSSSSFSADWGTVYRHGRGCLLPVRQDFMNARIPFWRSTGGMPRIHIPIDDQAERDTLFCLHSQLVPRIMMTGSHQKFSASICWDVSSQSDIHNVFA
jgi:hypothetical protein